MLSKVKRCLALLLALTLGTLVILGYRFYQCDDYHLHLAVPVQNSVHVNAGRSVPFSLRSGKYDWLKRNATSLGSVYSNPVSGIPSRGMLGTHRSSQFHHQVLGPTSVPSNASSTEVEIGLAGNQEDNVGSKMAVDDAGTENTTMHGTSHNGGEDSDYADLNACIEVGVSPRESTSHGWQTFKQALEDYKHFHHQRLSILKKMSLLLHSDNPQGYHLTNESIRTLTWACEAPMKCSGIGDQFFRIKLVFLLAVMTKRIFIISWDKESQKTTQYLQPNEIDWSFFDKNLGMHTKHDIKRLVTRDHYTTLFQLLNSSKPHVAMTEELYVPFLRGYYKSIHGDPDIMSGLNRLGLGDILSIQSKYMKESSTYISGRILRYLFKFSPDVLSMVEEVQKSLGILHHQHYLAVHIRTGFLGNYYEERGHLNPHRVFRSNASWLNTMDCSLKLADQIIGPDSPIYLASDSYMVKDLISQRYGDRIRTANMTLQHVQYIGKERRDVRMGGFMATWIDFLLLARSSVLVRSISGFSSTAGQFCSIPRQYCVPNCKC